MQMRVVAAALAAVFVSPATHAHCGGAFCALNTNWDVQGVWERPGVRLDLRAEFIDLDQLRHGTDKVAPGGVEGTHDEVRTINRNFVGTLDWSIDQDWGLTLQAPLTSRSHKHIHNDPEGPETETWNFTEIGDLQAIGRYSFYQGASSTAGVRFGLKLPTGSTAQTNDQGVKAERSLQPGTGSTDALLGFYYNQRAGSFTWFAQGMWQQVVHERAEFRPGRKVSADLGASYAVAPDWNLLLQLNALHKSRDTGANAEPDDSGSTQVFLSPGVAFKATRDLQVYGFFQQPLYQRMRGVQLTADWAAAVGLSYQF